MRSFWSNFAHAVRALTYVYANGGEGLTRVSQLAVLNANYVRVKVKEFLHTPYDEIVPSRVRRVARKNSSATRASRHSISRKRCSTAAITRRRSTSRCIVPECLMIEPTETESKETLDGFVEALREIVETAKTNPQEILDAPVNTVVGRIDETRAARQPDLRWEPAASTS